MLVPKEIQSSTPKNLNSLGLSVSVSDSFFAKFMPPFPNFLLCCIPIDAPIKAKGSKDRFCSFKQHFPIFLLIIIKVFCFHKFAGCHSTERVRVTGIGVNVLYSVSCHSRFSG